MKKIALLGAGDEQTEIIKLAKNLGYYVVSLDSNINAHGIQFSDNFFQCDISSSQSVYDIIKNQEIDGIMVHAIELSGVVSEVAEKLNLPAISSQVAYDTTNKAKRLEILKKNKISCANFHIVENLNQAKKSARDLGYPVVIKPIDNAGSRGVIIINDEIEMEKHFTESLHSCKKEKKILVEEFLSGPQISTETVVYKNKMYTTGFSDRNYNDATKFYPYFVEDGGDIPSKLPLKIQKKIINVVEKSISDLGIDFGAAKGDVVLKDDEPYIIEMASRTSGGRFASNQVPAATGINILKPLLEMSVNDPIHEVDFKKKFELGCSQRYLIPSPGKITSIHGVDLAKKSPGVFYLDIFKDLRINNIVKKIVDNTGKKGMIMATGNNREEAIKNVTKARELITIKTEPLP